MKKLFNVSNHGTKVIYGFILLTATFLFASCKKEAVNEIKQAEQANNETGVSINNGMKSEAEFINMYPGLSKQTTLELQRARAATARYRNIENALKDGYTNIGVDVENMGHHYMNTSLVDGTFDISKPELLVYNGDGHGGYQLVAVEYAVPIALSPNAAPQGFSGSNDVWDRNTGFGLWLLHAWVWYYNPDGVFNSTNPSIHLH